MSLEECIQVANKKFSDLTDKIVLKMKIGEYCEKEILDLEVLNKWREILEKQTCANADCGLDEEAQELLCKKINLF